MSVGRIDHSIKGVQTTGNATEKNLISQNQK